MIALMLTVSVVLEILITIVISIASPIALVILLAITVTKGDRLMPVISFVSSKGGVGKSTAVLVLAAEFARAGASRVTIIDADPNEPIGAWAKLPNKPEAVSVIAGVTEETVIQLL